MDLDLDGGGTISSGIGSLSVNLRSNSDKNQVGIILIDPTSAMHNTLCRGAIGGPNGSKFCTKHNCKIAAHKNMKTSIQTDTARYYIRGPRQYHAYCHPSLPVAWVQSEQDRTILEQERKSLPVWKLFFTRFENPLDQETASSESIMSGLEINAKDELDQLQFAQDAFKTPNKRQRVNPNLLESAMQTQELILPKRNKIVRFDMNLSTSNSNEENSEKIFGILNQWNDLIDQVETLQSGFDNRILSDQDFRETVLEHNLNTQAELSKIENMTRLLEHSMGTFPEGDASSSICDLISNLIKENTEFKEKFETLSLGKTQNLIQCVNQEIMVLKSSQAADKTSLVKIRSMFEEYRQVCMINKNNLDLLNNHYRKSFTNFRMELNELKMHHGSRVQPSQGFDFSNLPSDETRLNAIEADIKSAKDKMVDIINSLNLAGNSTDFVTLEARVKEMESRISGDSCSVNEGEFIFTSETEVTGWLQANQVASLGCFWDIFSVLVAMSPKQLSGKERADRQYSSDRINTTSAENDLAAAMAYIRPPTLYGDKNGIIGALEEGFTACAKHSIWIRGSESYKTKTTNQLKKFVKGLLGTMSHADGGYALARALLNEVVSQWTEFVGFIDAFFQDLTETANFGSDKAWKLVGQCCGAVFDAMEPYRAGVSQIEDLGRLESKSKFLWAVLQCHRVMKDFISKQFRGHPQMVKQISLFMIHERVDPLAFSKLETRVLQLEQAVSKQDKLITTMNRTLGNYENLNKTLSDVQRRLKTLENKK